MRSWRTALVALLALVPAGLRAQHAEHSEPVHAAHTFGTAEVPRAEPSHAFVLRLGPAQVLVHGNVQLQYFDVPSSRPPMQGEAPGRERRREFGAMNWAMGVLQANAGATRAELQLMLSAEPWTLPRCGYPLALGATALCGNAFVSNRQHPHDLVSALALKLERPLAYGVAAQVYGALVGEPAVGPVSYGHRLSAGGDLTAPASFHALDSEHSAAGVITAGVRRTWWKLEGSVFNGNAPDDDHVAIDLAPLASRAARLWLLPSDRWAAQVSIARIEDPEHALHSGGAGLMRRTTASISYYAPRPNGAVALTTAWGMDRDDVQRTSVVMLETAVSGRHDALFARVESLRRPDITTEVGTHDGGTHEFNVFRTFRVLSATAGYRRDVRVLRSFDFSIGGRIGVDVLPDDLAPNYNTGRPVTGAIFARVLPYATNAH